MDTFSRGRDRGAVSHETEKEHLYQQKAMVLSLFLALEAQLDLSEIVRCYHYDLVEKLLLVKVVELLNYSVAPRFGHGYEAGFTPPTNSRPSLQLSSSSPTLNCDSLLHP